jgi:uncharacterized protein YbjQ (UPF0145 family)
MSALALLVALALFCLPLVVPVVVLLVGFLIGSSREREHFADLDRREAVAAGVLVTNLKTFPGAVPSALPPRLVAGEVTIASDAMKNWLSKWRKFFGGEMHSYETLQRRARREACLRLVEKARAEGYNAICNLRIEGVDIAGAATRPSGGKQPAIVSVIASGTAYCWGQPH